MSPPIPGTPAKASNLVGWFNYIWGEAQVDPHFQPPVLKNRLDQQKKYPLLRRSSVLDRTPFLGSFPRVCLGFDSSFSSPSLIFRKVVFLLALSRDSAEHGDLCRHDMRSPHLSWPSSAPAPSGTPLAGPGQLGMMRISWYQLFSVAYFSREHSPKKSKRALLGLGFP